MMNMMPIARTFTERLAPCALARSSGQTAYYGAGFGPRHFCFWGELYEFV